MLPGEVLAPTVPVFSVKGTLNRADQEFLREAEAFVRTHWLDNAHLSAPLRLQRWQHALVQQGWSTPDWPTAYGGPGWGATRRYLWHSLCTSNDAPVALDAAATVVAPLLFARLQDAPDDPLALTWLQDIAHFQQRWSIAFVEPQAGVDVQTFATVLSPTRETTGTVRLSGGKTSLRGAECADWLCVLALLQKQADSGGAARSVPHWVAVETSAAGLTLQSSHDVSDSGQVLFDEVAVPATQLLAAARGEFSVEQLACSPARVLHQSAWLQRQVEMLGELVAGFSDEDNLLHRLHALAVDIQGLQGMELRYSDTLQKGAQEPFPLSVLALRGQQIFTQLGDLQVESFGYYALPYPDSLLNHNEGPVGPAGMTEGLPVGMPEEMTEAMARAMALQTSLMYEEFLLSVSTVRDQLAGKLKI